jgi:hypothetical protein
MTGAAQFGDDSHHERFGNNTRNLASKKSRTGEMKYSSKISSLKYASP